MVRAACVSPKSVRVEDDTEKKAERYEGDFEEEKDRDTWCNVSLEEVCN